MSIKKLVEYYSWHMDELLKLYNAMAGTDFGDTALLHLEIEEEEARIWVDGGESFALKL